LRRVRAVYKQWACSDYWPIDPRSVAPPDGFPGWPGGKRFAVVLTHDVEGKRGLDQVESLMALESVRGFRSSFNFVPEGEYRVPDSLRLTLEHAGFEVGIHGLKHDGKLYSSHAEFSRRAARIQEYRRKWRVAGFRSPFMHHDLEWIHELGMEYDASTFDTDPFEPQPDGAGTIFPFWVPNSRGGGYVELPYTLVQDYNLFIVLRQRTNEIWKRKLDWLAEHGGMVLINTHPDYMSFGGKRGPDQYAADHYAEWLSYISQNYRGTFWHALPRDMARFYRSTLTGLEPIATQATDSMRRSVSAGTQYLNDNAL